MPAAMIVPTKIRQLQFEVGGFALTDTRFGAGWRRERHTHDKAEFCFVLDGRFEETFGRTTVSGRPLDTSFKPAGAVHSTLVGGEGARCLVLEVPPSLERRASRAGPTLFRAGVPAELGARMVEELEIGDDLSVLALES